MIGLLVVILVFVGTGLTVVALAMRGGRRTNAKRSRGSQRLTVAGSAIVALAFGLGIPGLVLAHNAESQSKDASGGVQLSASEQDGRKIFAKNCATCHQLAAANAVGRVGPDLDVIIPAIPETKARIAFIDDAVANGRARGMGQMPKGLIDGTDQARVSAFVAKAAGR